MKLKYEPKNILVEADKDRVVQVVSNLIGNALKFTPNDGKFVFSPEKLDDKIARISIKDNGAGIDPEIMPRLFQKFATKSDKGTGLGLYISKNIIEGHGGKITAENNSDSKGATFAFTLPLSHDPGNQH